MPTGYTAYIEDGEVSSGNDFIMLCARAFGATISMRDEPLNKPIPEKFEISSYNNNQLETAKLNLSKIENMSNDDIQTEIDLEYNKNQQYYKNKIEENKIQYNRHINILNEIKKWIPPTLDHNELKQFAINQINLVLSDYAESDYYIDKINEVKPTIDQWKREKIESIKKDILYYTKEINAETKRIESRNDWIKQLRDSLN